MIKKLLNFKIFSLIFLMASHAIAASNSGFVYSGRILKPDGQPINSGVISITVSVKSPAPTSCLLYQERFSGIDMTGKNGTFSVTMGLPTPVGTRLDSTGISFNQVISNADYLNFAGLTCASGTTYVPAAKDERVMSATFDDGTAVVSVDNLEIKSVPYAMHAAEVGGYGIANLPKISGAGSATVLSPEEYDFLKNLAAPAVATSTPCAANQILQMNAGGTAWVCSGAAAGESTTVTNLGTGTTLGSLNVNAVEFKSIAGTLNQISISDVAGTLTLSLPQSINTTATPTFGTPTAAGHAVIKSYADANLLGQPVTAPGAGQVGQAIRWNAGNTAWEYYTPSTGSVTSVGIGTNSDLALSVASSTTTPTISIAAGSVTGQTLYWDQTATDWKVSGVNYPMATSSIPTNSILINDPLDQNKVIGLAASNPSVMITTGGTNAPTWSLGSANTFLKGGAAGISWSAIALGTADVSGVLTTDKGGTGASSYTNGEILVGQTAGNTLSKVILNGDATMTETGLVNVQGIRGKSVSSTVPTIDGQIYQYEQTGGTWVTNSAAAPTAGQVLKWNNASKRWEPGADNDAGIGSLVDGIGTTFNSTKYDINYDSNSLLIDGSNRLQVNYDDSTIGIIAGVPNKMGVKAGGISDAQVAAAAAIARSKLANSTNANSVVVNSGLNVMTETAAPTAAGQFLGWDGSVWAPVNVGVGNLSGGANGDVLYRTGGVWTAGTPNTAGIVDLTSAQTITGAKTFTSGVLLRDADTNTITLQSPALTANYSLTLPDNDGTAAGQVLTTDGNGVLTWTTPTVGTVTSVTAGAGLAQNGTAAAPQLDVVAAASGALTVNANDMAVNYDNSTVGVNGSNQLEVKNTSIGAGKLTGGAGAGEVFYTTAANTWAAGTADTAGLVTKAGAQTITGAKTFTSGVLLRDADTDTITLQAPALAAPYSLTFPNTAGTANYALVNSATPGQLTWAAVGTGSVTTVSVATANGFGGTVATNTTTPAITITTGVTGMVKGDGTAISAATAGTDYSVGTSALATGILKSTTTTGSLSIATASDFPNLNGYYVDLTTGQNVGGAKVFTTSIALEDTDAGTNKIVMQAPTTIAADYTLTWPATVAGSAGQVLTSDTSGNLTWTTPTVGTVTSVTAGAGLAQNGTAAAPVLDIAGAANGAITANANDIAVNYDNTTVGVNGSNQLEVKNTSIGAGKLTGGAGAGEVFYTTAANTWAAGTADTAGLVTKAGAQTITGAKTFTSGVLLRDADTNTVSLLSPALAADYNLTFPNAVAGSNGMALVGDTSGNLSWAAVGTGSVTGVSVVSTNGMGGTVANSSTTPAITLTTSVTGMVKGNGTAFSAATAGTDFSAGTSALATGILKSTTTTGSLSIATASDFPNLNGYYVDLTTGQNVGGAKVFTTSIALEDTDAGTNKIVMQAPTTIAADYTLTWPATVAGSAGQVLTSDTSGNLTWTTPTVGTVTSVTAGAGLAQNGTAAAPQLDVVAAASGALTVNANDMAVNYDNSTVGVNGSNQLEVKNTSIGAGKLTGGAGAGEVFYTTAANTWAAGTADTAGLVTKAGAQTITGAKTFTSGVLLRDADTDTITLQAPALAAPYSLTFPNTAGTANYALVNSATPGQLTWAAVGTGSVTTVSVASANGFAGSVSNASTTPAITISTSITGMLKGNGTAISAGTAGTDYSVGTSALATGILKSTTTTGALSIATASDFPNLNGYYVDLTTGQNVGGAKVFTSSIALEDTDAGTNKIVMQAPTTIAADYTLTWPATVAASNGQVLTSDTSGNLTWTTAASAGEINTASNYGIGGVGLYNDKNVADLRFKNINAGDTTITVTNDAANREVDIAVGAIPASKFTGGATGDVFYATAANTWAAGSPDTAGLVTKAGAQTITGAKTFTSGVLLRDADTNTVSLLSPALAANYNLTFPNAVAGSNGMALVGDTSGNLSWAAVGTGSVTTVSVASANGFAGSVSNASTTPAITISTSITGMLKGNGTAISAGTAGTDYSAGTSALATGILKSTTTTGALSIATASDIPTPMTTLGDVMYGGASGANTRLAGNTTATKKFLRQTGDGTNSAAPAWDTLVAGDIPDISATYWKLGGNAPAATGVLGTTSNQDLSIITNNAAKMTILKTGEVGIGTTNPIRTSLDVAKIMTGGVSVYGVESEGVIQSDVTSNAFMFDAYGSTAAAAFTLGNLTYYRAHQSTIGAGSSITNQYGFVADSAMIGATNNYGFYSDIASGAGRWNFYANGTANNYFGGNVGIGITAPNTKLDVRGGAYANNQNFGVDIGTPTGANGWLAGIRLKSDAGGIERLGIDVPSNATFGTSEIMSLRAGGVGIGVTAPTEKLEVAGAIKIGTTATACAAGVAGAIQYTGGSLQYCNGTTWTTLGAGGGEANTMSNLAGTAGAVGVYKQKTGVDFEMKKINAGSNKVSITDDTTNNEVDIDLNEANLSHANIGGIVPLSKGGTGANLGNGTAGQILTSTGAGAAAAWTTAVFPATTTINQLLFSNAANTVTGLATANTGALVTSSTGVPSIVSGATANRILRTDGTTVSFAQVGLTTDVTGVLPIANGGTGSSTQNFVDLTTAQLVGGAKTFTTSMALEDTDAGTNKIVMQAPTTIAADYTLTWPATVAASAGQVLTSDTSGNLSWTTPAAGAVTSVTAGAGLVQNGTGAAPVLDIAGAASGAITANANDIAVNYDNTTVGVNGSNQLEVKNTSISAAKLTGGVAGDVHYATGANTWAIGSPNTAGLVALAGAQTITGAKTFTSGVLLRDADTNTISLLSPALAANYNLTFPNAVAGSNGMALVGDTSGNLSWAAVGTGSVTTVSVASANGFAGSVSNASTTPAITISTSITGMLKGNGTAISAGTAGTDYSAGTSALATGILKSTTTTGALSIAVAGDFPTLNQNTTGTAANVTGIVAIANGGTNKALSIGVGTIPYFDADSMEVLAAGSAGQMLQSNGAAAPTWSTATYPNTTTINQLLFSNAANTVTGLATANTGALVTSSTGVPSIVSGATANRVLRTDGTTVSFAQVGLTTDVTGVLPIANGGTGSSTQNFVDLTTAQTVAGVKTFSSNAVIGGGGTGSYGLEINRGDSAALRVYNSAAAAVANSSLIYLAANNASGTAVNYGYMGTYVNATTAGAQSGSLLFGAYNAGASREIMRLIGTTGNVGIGVVSPNTKLDVAGALKVANDATACSATIAGSIRYDGTNMQFCDSTNTWINFGTGSSTGTVSTVSVASANGFAGSVTNPTTTPAITISTSVTGMLKGNGTAISAGTAGTDYSAGTAALATGILKSTTTTGALTIAVAGDFPTLNQNTTGTAANVTGTVAVANGGTGLTAGTSGGIPYFNSTTTMASTALLTANGVMLGGGAGAAPTATAAGAAYSVLRVPSGGGAPVFGAIDISQGAAVTGILPVANGGTGSSTQNFVDLTTAQTAAGAKTWSNNAVFSANVSVGTTSSLTRLHVEGPRYLPGSNYDAVATMYSTDALGAGVGGGVMFGGNYTGTTKTTFAEISGVKLNATDGDYAGNLLFKTRVNGGAMTTRMTVDQVGNVGIGTTTPVTNLNVQGVPVTNRGNVQIDDTTAQAAGTGGAISLGGKYTDAGAYTSGVMVSAEKENATTGNYSFALGFSTYLNGNANLVERLRIPADGGLQFAGHGTVPGLSAAGTSKVYYDTTDNKLKVSYNGGAYADLSAAAGGSGTVTSVSVTTANGFGGTVATNTTTPAITITTGVTGMLKGNGTAISAGTAGTDYSAGTAALATGILKSTTTTGALTIAVAGDFPTLNQNTTGTAANVTGTVAVANGGTGLTAGTSGGIPYFNSTTTMASSALLTANGVMLGGGAGAAPTTTAAGAAYSVLRVPSGGGAPAFGAIDISQSAAVTGLLPIANGGTGASSAAQNAVFAGPSTGGAGAPSFRALAAADIPSLAANYVDLTTAQTAAGAKTWSGDALFSGKVGIGVPSTTSNKLTIEDTSTTAAKIRFASTTSGGGFLTSSSVSQALIAGGAEWNGANTVARHTAASAMSLSNGNVTLYTDASLTVGANFTHTPRMTINTDGKVGIGTTSPVANLDVSLAAGIDSTLRLASNPTNTAVSITPWANAVYIGAGVSLQNGAWTHDNGAGANNSLFTLAPGTGALWYASNDSAPSWNVASGVGLWNATGTWTAPVASTRSISSASAATTGATIDLSLANATSTSYDCTGTANGAGGEIALQNIRDGGTYTIVVTGAGTPQCGFNTTTTGTDAATVSYKFRPTNGVRTASTHSVYTLMRIGSVIYVSWASGFN